MTTLAWGLALLVALAAIYLGLRWRRAEAEARSALDHLRQAREQAATLAAESEQRSAYLQALDRAELPALFLIDQARVVLWLNEAGRGLCIGEIELPIPLSKALRSYEILDLVDRALASADHFDREYMRDGRVFHADARQVIEQPALVAVLVRDVTEAQRLGRAQREFVANISHDLRTPIAAIQLMVETLIAGAADNPKRRSQLLTGIAEQTATLQQLAQEVLDLSLIESGRMPLRLIEIGVAELIEPIRQRMQPQAELKTLGLAAGYDPALRVLADPDNTRRVLQNLLHNAIKFTPAGGRIELGAAAQGEDVLFSVRDTGIGIAPDQLERVFERFHKLDRTRGEEGAGLGLAIARHIVRGHGGRIWVESEPGKGATFFFTLPRA